MLNRSLWKNEIIICITLDLDWASEDCLKFTTNYIDDFKATYFITHPSKIIMDKIQKKEAHGGIHPNFHKESSQGKNIDEVLNYLYGIFPEANCFRCHKYFDNNDITDALVSRGFKYDSNLCTSLEVVEPFVHRSGLIRFPIFFEDGAYLLQKNSLIFKEIEKNIFKGPGIYIFNFHPMHIYLNTPTYSYMRKIKNNTPSYIWNNLSSSELNHLRYNGHGIRSFTSSLFKFIKKENLQVMSLGEIFEGLFK